MKKNNDLVIGRVAIAREHSSWTGHNFIMGSISLMISIGVFGSFTAYSSPEGLSAPIDSSFFLVIPLSVIVWYILKCSHFLINLLRYKSLLQKKKEFVEEHIMLANKMVRDIDTIYLAIESIDSNSPELFNLIKGIERKLSSLDIHALFALADENYTGSGEQMQRCYRSVRESFTIINMPDILFDIATNTEETLTVKDELKRRCQDAANSFILFSAVAHRNLRKMITMKKILLNAIKNKLGKLVTSEYVEAE
ncbi:MAG: hypothetical protein HGB03_01965 [Candidatus Yonathbacteria bacterium]|nr:hypothetical protein [Candidatus Yonathbacteria bacterium]NTW48025.1 hypothetical protein [Candidatus Yonathbacteria bacterium]